MNNWSKICGNIHKITFRRPPFGGRKRPPSCVDQWVLWLAEMRTKKKIVCFRLPARTYFFGPTLTFFQPFLNKKGFRKGRTQEIRSKYHFVLVIFLTTPAIRRHIYRNYDWFPITWFHAFSSDGTPGTRPMRNVLSGRIGAVIFSVPILRWSEVICAYKSWQNSDIIAPGLPVGLFDARSKRAHKELSRDRSCDFRHCWCLTTVSQIAFLWIKSEFFDW